MFRFASALLALGLVNAQQCFNGDLTIDGKSVPQDAFVEMWGQVAAERGVAHIKSNKEFQSVMESRKKCQDGCFGRVFHTSFKTLVGNLGNNMFDASSADHAVEALTGAFLACYPSHPREHVLDMVTQCVTMPDMQSKPADAINLLAHGGSCTGPEGSTEENRADFIEMFNTQFPKALKTVLKAHPDVAKELLMTKDCQKECMVDTLLSSVTNLYDSGLIAHDNADELATEALTGAAKACFPSVPHDTMKALVTEIKSAALDAGKEANTETEQTEMAAQTSSYAVSIPAAMVIGLFAGTVVHFAMLRFGRKVNINSEPLLTA